MLVGVSVGLDNQAQILLYSDGLKLSSAVVSTEPYVEDVAIGESISDVGKPDPPMLQVYELRDRRAVVSVVVVGCDTKFVCVYEWAYIVTVTAGSVELLEMANGAVELRLELELYLEDGVTDGVVSGEEKDDAVEIAPRDKL
jgi:hypothetical protein